MFVRLIIFSLVCVVPLALGFQGTKVGIVDADTVIQESLHGKAFLQDLEIFSQAKRQELEIKGEELKSYETDLQTKIASMSDAKIRESNQKTQILRREIERLTEDAQREAESKLKQGLDQIRNEMLPIIRQIALEKNLDMILNMGPQSQVVYFHDRINITNDVIKKYDELMK